VLDHIILHPPGPSQAAGKLPNEQVHSMIVWRGSPSILQREGHFLWEKTEQALWCCVFVPWPQGLDQLGYEGRIETHQDLGIPHGFEESALMIADLAEALSHLGSEFIEFWTAKQTFVGILDPFNLPMQCVQVDA
jgi:hypothetical protein